MDKSWVGMVLVESVPGVCPSFSGLELPDEISITPELTQRLGSVYELFLDLDVFSRQ